MSSLYGVNSYKIIKQDLNDTIAQIKKYWGIGLISFLLLLLVTARLTYIRLRKAQTIQQEFQQKLSEQVTQRTQELELDSGILHNINEAIVIANSEGNIIKTNQPFEKLIDTKSTRAQLSIWHILAQTFYGFNSDKTVNLMLKQNQIRQEVLLKSDEEQHYLIDIFTMKNANSESSHTGFLLTNISHFKSAQNELEALANYDNVTGLANRHLFQTTLQSWIKEQQDFAVLFIDLDNFKWINDTQGHAEGDRVLEQVAQLLTRLIPDQTHNLVARLGGDEFALLCRGLGELQIASLANQIIGGVKDLYQIINPSKTLGCSIGIAHYPKDGQNREDIMTHADYAMYKAKEQGKNRYCLFSDEMNEQIHYLYDSEIRLHRALEKQEFFLVYQLQYRLDTLAVSGAEALIRWQAEDRLVSPAEFIPLAEKFGLIQSVGRFVLNAALAQIVTWNKQTSPLPRVSINVSTAQLNGDGFVAEVEQQLEHYQIDPHQLELEITESLLMDHLSEDNKALHTLQHKGLEIAIDDFGTGYSSLAYIKHLNVDRIKIDQSFVRDLEYNAESFSIVKTIINMGHSLGLKVIAEGIETREQLNILRELGCDEGQGYLLAKPQKPEELSFGTLKL
jgi:diguanylate cyclase (GGDEF)-like protein